MLLCVVPTHSRRISPPGTGKSFVVITQMHLKGLMFDPYNNAYIVVLRDEDGQEMLPIWVGKAEAGAISMALENVAPTRPMNNDLLTSVMDARDAKVIIVVITY